MIEPLTNHSIVNFYIDIYKSIFEYNSKMNFQKYVESFQQVELIKIPRAH